MYKQKQTLMNKLKTYLPRKKLKYYYIKLIKLILNHIIKKVYINFYKRQ